MRRDDICYACDGTGTRDWLSGAPCHECDGTGWVEERAYEYDDDCDAFWEAESRSACSHQTVTAGNDPPVTAQNQKDK